MTLPANRSFVQLNNTPNCFSIQLINDLPFKNGTLGYYYSKIYDFNAKERFNLTSGSVELQPEQQPSTKSNGQNRNSISSQLIHWFAFVFTLFIVWPVESGLLIQ